MKGKLETNPSLNITKNANQEKPYITAKVEKNMKLLNFVSPLIALIITQVCIIRSLGFLFINVCDSKCINLM